MAECQHIVGFSEGYGDSDSMLEYDWLVLDSYRPEKPDECFKYCPLCGETLDAFWQKVDAKIAAYDRDLE